MHWTKKVLDDSLPDRSATNRLKRTYTTLPCSAFEYHFFVSLFHGQCTDEDSEGDEQYAPLCPSPALILRCKAADDRTALLSVATRTGQKTYPRDGPANGAMRKTVVTLARFAGEKRSAVVPAPVLASQRFRCILIYAVHRLDRSR